MLPSSSRVKLNRVALKDVVGLEPAPRRRRVPPGNVRASSGKRGSDPELSGAVSEKDTTTTTTTTSSIPGSSEPVRGVRDRVGPDSETGTEDSRVDINRNTYPSPTGLAGSEGSLRRAVTASRCGLCGDSKFISPQQKTLGKQGQKSSSQRPERSMVELKIKRGNPVTETSKKPIVGIDRYLKVTLCDIAQKYDVCGHDFGCVLPDALKTKVVRCFKQDMRAGFRLGPSCLKQDKHKSEESALTKKSKLCPRVQSGKRVCQSQSLNEHKRDLKEHTDAENSSSHTTYHFPEGWPSEASTTCSVSLILGKRTNSGCKTSMWDRNVEEEPGSRAEFYRDKRIKLGDSIKDGRLRSTPDLESINCNEQAKACCISKEKTFSGTSEYSWPCLEYKCGGCSTCRSTVKENCVHKIPYGQIGEPRKNDAAQISSKLFCQRNQADTDELESFTCQRVRVYCRKINSTCARTYFSWPFSNISHTLTAHAGTTALPEEAVRPSARNKSDSPKNQNQSSPPSSQTTDMLPSAPTDPPSDATQLFFCQNEEKQEEKGEHTIAKRNGTRHGTMSSYSSDSKTTEFVAHIMEAEKTLASLVPNTASLAILSQHGKEPGTNTVSVPSTPVNGPETDSSMSTPSPSALGLSDWETTTTLSPMSSLFKHGSLSSLSATPSPLPPSTFPPEQVKGVKLAEAHSTSMSSTAFSPKHIIKAVEKPLFYCEETQMTLCCSSARASSFSSHNSDSFHSCESSPFLLPQDAEGSDIETFTDMSQSQLEPYYNASACNENPPLALEQSVETTSNDFMLPPLLSPVNSPQGHLCISFLPQKQCSNEEEQEQEEINKDTRKHKMLPGHHMPQIGDGNIQNYEENPDHHQHEGHSNEELEGVSSKYKTLSSHSSVGDLNDGIKEESRDKTDYTEYVEQGIGGSEQVPLVLKIKANLPSGVLTEPCSPPSSDAEQPRSTRDEDSCPSENAGGERDKTEAVGDTWPGILDECAAYEQDILLVNVIQDDPELFENLPEESVLKLGPTGVSEAPKTRLTGVVKKLSPMIDGASLEFEQRSTPVIVNFHCDSPDTTEESNNRPWRPQSSSSTSKTQNSTWPATDEKTRNMGQSDKNDNDDVNGDLERSQPIQTLNSPHNIPPLMTVRNGQWITNPVNMTDFRRQKSNAYCRQYFSESLSCGFKMCRFQHVPVEGDEKFCVETVMRFIKNPMCLQKAGAVFTGYYQNNPPGVYFSMSVLLSLLQALLKAGMVSDIFSVLSVSLAHKILPGHEFLLALFNFVRENGLMGSVPELMQLTFRMASAGLVLSLDCLDCVKNTPEFHQTVHPNSPVSLSGHIKQVNLHVYHKRLSTSAPPPEYLKFAHSVVEIELCTKQEDWRRMGEVFRSICQSSQHPNQVEQISGRIAIALLSESKDKLSLPFSAFADTVCRCEGEDSLIRSFLGRIGVSLMLRYHKTHQWTKGRRVVEVLATSKVSYSTLKGLFGNEDGASRCYLVTVATELFLLSGSVEGALNTLRDLDSRSRVLMRLAEKTSHRDTLEVLCNLPGMKEPNDLIDISRYGPLFNSHLQVCVDRQILSIASDTVDFMLSKNLAVDHAMLQILLLKLGKQNLWLRAREVFRDSLNVGYYPGLLAPPGFMALIVPCRLGEVELALTFEMFISVNAAVILQLSETATSCLSITLKRTQSGESEYLSAGSRLLSAACIPQPKLIVHYKAVNSSQEQVFTLDISSARRWLRHNHLWANEVWTH